MQRIRSIYLGSNFSHFFLLGNFIFYEVKLKQVSPLKVNREST